MSKYTDGTRRKVIKDGRRLGRAAEHRVLAELILRGHTPYIPDLDEGTDVVLENGIRIQIKSCTLRIYNERIHAERARAYMFDFYKRSAFDSNGKRKSTLRDWSKHCDYFVLWCVDEDRFFVVPIGFLSGCTGIVVKQLGDHIPVVDVTEAKRLHAQGVSLHAIAKRYGVSQPTARRAVYRGISRATDKTRILLQFESRWDLLDTNSVVEKLVESAEPLLVPKEQ